MKRPSQHASPFLSLITCFMIDEMKEEGEEAADPCLKSQRNP